VTLFVSYWKISFQLQQAGMAERLTPCSGLDLGWTFSD
jgi:hypothetical protein